MDKRNIRNGQVLVNKLNQKKYTYANGVGTEVLTDEQVEQGVQPDTINITDNNVVCFAVVEDPNFDKYELEDGTFKANGRIISTGNIKITKILVSGKRKALLAVATRDDSEKGVDIFTYNAELDQFKKIASNVVLTGVEIKAGDTVILPYENIEVKDRDVTQPDGTVTTEQYKILEKSGLVEFNTVSCYGAVYDVNAMIGGLAAEADGYDKEDVIKTLVFSSTSNTERNYGDEPDYDDDEDDEDDSAYEGDEIKPLDGKVLVRIVKVKTDGRLVIDTGREIEGKFVSATRAGRDMVIITDKKALLGGYVLEDANALKMIAGYPYLVKNEYDEKKDERVISMANVSYDVKTIVLTNTEDRGMIVTEM